MAKKFRKVRKKGRVVEYAQYCFDIFAFLLLIGALDFLFYQVFGSRAESFGEVNGPRLGVSIVVYLIALILTIYRVPAVKRVMSTNLFLWALFFMPLVSLLWTVDFRITFFRASAYLLSCVFSLYLVVWMKPEEFFRRVMMATFIGGVLSLLWVAISPGDAIHTSGPLSGAWKGVYGHKNELGRIGSIAIVMSFFCDPKNTMQKYIRITNILMYLALVFLSDSKTNWLIIMAMVGFVPLTNWLRSPIASPSLRLIAVGTGAALLSTLVLVNSSLILEAMGRDDSFSGRGTLWGGVSAIIASKYPVLGAGYGAFFTDAGGVWDLKGYLRFWSSLPNHAHNGFLNVQADMGYPGLIVLIWFLVLSGFRVVMKMIDEPERKVWAGFAALLFLFIVNNISESNAFVHSDIPWIMLLVGYAYLAPTHKVWGIKKRGRTFKFRSLLRTKSA